MGCPQCQSKDWKSASRVYRSSLNDVTAVTSLVGEPRAYAKGHRRMALSAHVMPPRKPRNVAAKWYWGASSAVIAVAWGGGGPRVACVAGAVALGGWLWNRDALLKGYRAALAQYQADFARWNRTRVCQRCGLSYETK